MLQNLLLAVLPEAEQRRIAKHCEVVQLQGRQTLHEPDTPVSHVWFPHSGVCSTLVHVDNGEAVDVGLVGREGMVGLPLVLGSASNAFHVVVQVAGTATRIAREAFLDDVIAPGHPFCDGLLRYANLYLSNVAQTAACNRLHRIEQRLARWLLDLQERTQTDAQPVTHEFLALMVGAYRPSVTNALKALEERGALRVQRGMLIITNLSLLKAEACECHDAVSRRTASTLDQIKALSAA